MNIKTIKTAKDIKDRQDIIYNYRINHFLDRARAIELIRDGRFEDEKIAIATVVAQSRSSIINFDKASDETLISELQMQIDIMTAELVEDAQI